MILNLLNCSLLWVSICWIKLKDKGCFHFKRRCQKAFIGILSMCTVYIISQMYRHLTCNTILMKVLWLKRSNENKDFLIIMMSFLEAISKETDIFFLK